MRRQVVLSYDSRQLRWAEWISYLNEAKINLDALGIDRILE